MPLPLKDMLNLADEASEERLASLQLRQRDAAKYFLDHANKVVIGNGFNATRVIIAELAVFQTNVSEGNDHSAPATRFATFAAADSHDHLDSYLTCVKDIQQPKGERGPLVLMNDFYEQGTAFISPAKPVTAAGTVQPHLEHDWVGKFEAPESTLDSSSRSEVAKTSPAKRFDHFANLVRSSVRICHPLSIMAVTLDCSNSGRSTRAALFVVLQHAADSTEIKEDNCEIAQRTFALLGSLLAGNLLETWATHRSASDRLRALVFPTGNPKELGYCGKEFETFFDSERCGGGPPHNFEEGPRNEQKVVLHDDVKHYFKSILRFTNPREAEVKLKGLTEREDQPKRMHELMKSLFLLRGPKDRGNSADIELDLLPFLAAACLEVDTKLIDLTKFKRGVCLSVLPDRSRRMALVEALIEFFIALQGPAQTVTIDCGDYHFEIKVAPFNARQGREQGRQSLMDKLRGDPLSEAKGDLFRTIVKIQHFLSLSGLCDGEPKSMPSCVFSVIPSESHCDSHFCRFRFQAVNPRKGN